MKRARVRSPRLTRTPLDRPPSLLLPPYFLPCTVHTPSFLHGVPALVIVPQGSPLL